MPPSRINQITVVPKWISTVTIDVVLRLKSNRSRCSDASKYAAMRNGGRCRGQVARADGRAAASQVVELEHLVGVLEQCTGPITR